MVDMLNTKVSEPKFVLFHIASLLEKAVQQYGHCYMYGDVVVARVIYRANFTQEMMHRM